MIAQDKSDVVDCNAADCSQMSYTDHNTDEVNARRVMADTALGTHFQTGYRADMFHDRACYKR